MINQENLIKIGRVEGHTSNRETPGHIGSVGISAAMILGRWRERESQALVGQ